MCLPVVAGRPKGAGALRQIQHDDHRARGDTGGDPIRSGDTWSGRPSGFTLLWGEIDGRHAGDARDIPIRHDVGVECADGLACSHRLDGLLLAACRLIDLQLAHPGLDVSFIASRLGCSRATLYRAFAARELAVAGYIRERRLQRVWGLLHSLPASVPIAEVARRCGFLDSTSFSRMFRRRFGVRARDVRAGG